jgi:hypothetical protein
MNNILHICFSESARGCLRYGTPVELRRKTRVISFLDDLSSGPLEDMNNINRRIEWNKRIITSDFDELLDNIIHNYDDIKEEILNIRDEDIYIWYGENGSELTGLLYILSLLKDKLDNVYIINVSERPYVYNGNTIQYHRSAREVSHEKLDWFTDMKKKLTKEDYTSLMKQWGKLQHENSSLRVMKDKSTMSVPESYFDEIILKYTDCNFGRCARTVGQVLGREENYISDFYIFWRILELIRLGKVEYRGKLGNMRDMEIRRRQY